MNDDFELMVRRREIVELLASGAAERDWPALWHQAERSAGAGAMRRRSLYPKQIYLSSTATRLAGGFPLAFGKGVCGKRILKPPAHWRS